MRVVLSKLSCRSAFRMRHSRHCVTADPSRHTRFKYQLLVNRSHQFSSGRSPSSSDASLPASEPRDSSERTWDSRLHRLLQPEGWPRSQLGEGGQSIRVDWTSNLSSDLDVSDLMFRARGYRDFKHAARHCFFDSPTSSVRLEFANGKRAEFHIDELWRLSREQWEIQRRKQRENIAEWTGFDMLPEVQLSFDDVMTSDPALFEVMSSLCKFGFCVLKSGSSKLSATDRLCERLAGLRDTEHYGLISHPSVMNESGSEFIYNAFGRIDMSSQLIIPGVGCGPQALSVGLSAIDNGFGDNITDGLEVIHCLKGVKTTSDEMNGVKESLMLVDTLSVAAQLRSKHMDAFDTLSSVPAVKKRVDHRRGASAVSYPARPVIQLSSIDYETVTQVVSLMPDELSSLEMTAEHLIDGGNPHQFNDALRTMAGLVNEMQLEVQMKEQDIVIFNNQRVRGSINIAAAAAKEEAGSAKGTDSKMVIKQGMVRMDWFRIGLKHVREQCEWHGLNENNLFTVFGDGSEF